MIKILRAFETAPFDETASPSLHVDLEIDGYEWGFGGLPVEFTLDDLKAYLKTHHKDMLRQAKLKPIEKKYPYDRPDLITEFTPTS